MTNIGSMLKKILNIIEQLSEKHWSNFRKKFYENMTTQKNITNNTVTLSQKIRQHNFYVLQGKCYFCEHFLFITYWNAIQRTISMFLILSLQYVLFLVY